MARKPRRIGKSGAYHVILRGNNKQLLFYDNEDRRKFIEILKKYTKELEVKLYSHTLMGNHVHLQIGHANGKMDKLIKKICCAYVPYFNKKYERTGHLFHSRYKSEPIEDDVYFKDVTRYILLNPQKAGICNFRNYCWSSYSEYNKRKSFVDTDFVIGIFGSQKLFEDFLDEERHVEVMEADYKPFNNDSVVIAFIKQLFCLENILMVRNEDFSHKKNIINRCHEIGFSWAQLSRIFEMDIGYMKKLCM